MVDPRCPWRFRDRARHVTACQGVLDGNHPQRQRERNGYRAGGASGLLKQLGDQRIGAIDRFWNRELAPVAIATNPQPGWGHIERAEMISRVPVPNALALGMLVQEESTGAAAAASGDTEG